MRAAASAIGMGRGIQRGAFFQKHRDQGSVDFIGQVFPLDELASAGQGNRFIRWHHFVENRFKGVTEPLACFLPIRQRWHGILHEKSENRPPQPIVPPNRKA